MSRIVPSCPWDKHLFHFVRGTNTCPVRPDLTAQPMNRQRSPCWGVATRLERALNSPATRRRHETCRAPSPPTFAPLGACPSPCVDSTWPTAPTAAPRHRRRVRPDLTADDLPGHEKCRAPSPPAVALLGLVRRPASIPHGQPSRIDLPADDLTAPTAQPTAAADLPAHEPHRRRRPASGMSRRPASGMSRRPASGMSRLPASGMSRRPSRSHSRRSTRA